MSSLSSPAPIHLFPGDIALIDMDEVIVDFMRNVLAGFRKHPEIPPLDPKRLRSLYFTQEYGPRDRPTVEKLIRKHGFFSSMHPIPGAIDAIRRMIAHGVHVRFCTSPVDKAHHCAAEKTEWIARFFHGCPADRWIIPTHDKTLIRGKVLIDDNPEIKGLLKTDTDQPSWQHIVFDRPWNQVADHPHLVNVPRFSSWENYGWQDAFTLSR